MSAKRSAHACEVVDNQMYVMGGIESHVNGSSTILSTTEVYDPAAEAWRAGPHMETLRAHPYSGVLDGRLYVLCGVNAVCTQCALYLFT
jgi:N-acetylneuraminic acid mutarotase